MFDIHSHILPEIDDGSESLEESIAILEIMKQQGITDVIATPHFYPHEDSLTDFIKDRNLTYKSLLNAVAGRDLPNIYLGCEILYFEGLCHSRSINNLCLNNSNYLLIELTDECIGNLLMSNLHFLKENTPIIPIIAHVERYAGSKNYRKFIKFLKKEKILVQINASSVTERIYDKVIKKLIKSELAILIGTDAHSPEMRPPLMDKAFNKIEAKYGKPVSVSIRKNMNKLYNEIVGDSNSVWNGV